MVITLMSNRTLGHTLEFFFEKVFCLECITVKGLRSKKQNERDSDLFITSSGVVLSMILIPLKTLRRNGGHYFVNFVFRHGFCCRLNDGFLPRRKMSDVEEVRAR